MAVLTLTQEEERANRYLALDDAALGKIVKYAATILADESGDCATRWTAAALVLIDAAAEIGSARTDFEITGVTRPEPVGDWVITVQRKESKA